MAVYFSKNYKDKNQISVILGKFYLKRTCDVSAILLHRAFKVTVARLQCSSHAWLQLLLSQLLMLVLLNACKSC